jgi:hypothetical protein
MKSPTTTTRAAIGAALMASALMACSDRAKQDGRKPRTTQRQRQKVGDVARTSDETSRAPPLMRRSPRRTRR